MSIGKGSRPDMAARNKAMATHGKSKTKEFSVWGGIKDRCLNFNQKDYVRYGGRGIKICDRWKSSFKNFLEDMGRCPTKKHQIDRIDNDGNYEPGNCRWVTVSRGD